MKINNCRICESNKIYSFFDLGDQPLANSFIKKEMYKEKKYPLILVYCNDCFLVQLSYSVDPQKIFSNYVWVTGTSKTAKDFSYLFYSKLMKRTAGVSNRNVFEIASNDGTFLLPFKKKKFNVLGIDSAKNICAIAKKNGIPTEAAFFGAATALKIVKSRGKAGIVFARNVLPHVVDPRDFVEGLNILLEDKGVLAIEVHYAKIILEELHYDSIYHEHLCYFTLYTIEKLLNKFGLYIFDISRSPISGGSIIVYASKIKKKEELIVQYYRNLELKERINNLSSWKNFAKNVMNHKKKFIDILKKANEKGIIVGYGASARSSTLLNFCKITKNYISIIADKNPMKQGLYTPGSNIFIADLETVLAKKPCFIVLLAWNFKEEVIETINKKFKYKGKYVIPFPKKPYIVGYE